MQQLTPVMVAGEPHSLACPEQQECWSALAIQANTGIAAQKAATTSSTDVKHLPTRIVYLLLQLRF